MAKATEGYCAKCRARRNMRKVEAVTMSDGRPATRGVCTVCGSKMFKVGSSKVAGTAPKAGAKAAPAKNSAAKKAPAKATAAKSATAKKSGNAGKAAVSKGASSKAAAAKPASRPAAKSAPSKGGKKK